MRFRIVAVALVLPSAALAQTGDPVAGAKQFGQCRTCHTTVSGGPDGIGPNLVGVYGTTAGSHRPRYPYSAALKASKLTWNDATLDKWLADPAALVKGTKMAFIGLPRKPARDNIIAYLKTLK